MKRFTHFLIGALLALSSLSAFAADIDRAGLPSVPGGGGPVWARKTGTTNTMQDITSHSNALDIYIAGGSTTPPTGASATEVQGTVADGSADTAAKPVEIGGSTGVNIETLRVDSRGAIEVGSTASALGDNQSNTAQQFFSAGDVVKIQTLNLCWDGTTWDRCATASIGNNVGSTGIGANGAYGQYLNNANQPALTTGNYGAAQVDPAGNLRTAPQRPTATDILSASASVTATTASTTGITVSAGRTWVGDVCVSVAGSKAGGAASDGEVRGTILTAGTNVTPAAGTYYEVDTAVGANVATGTVGTQGSNQGCTKFTAVAPAGNAVTVNYSATCTNTTACRASFSFNGVMQ